MCLPAAKRTAFPSFAIEKPKLPQQPVHIYGSLMRSHLAAVHPLSASGQQVSDIEQYPYAKNQQYINYQSVKKLER